ncbi:protein of unknown function [Candidatus Nitrosocosmicus franklandus]|uniref:Uncharacterized protein n=1 Tax=Candidatus Nitrosocosmicus franklandianus TaxID=1798806 RepID=A0A484IA38_9ARCH|nr:protein of unknown function [Candidatus Nitrosocosmicus franklandus]
MILCKKFSAIDVLGINHPVKLMRYFNLQVKDSNSKITTNKFCIPRDTSYQISVKFKKDMQTL